MNLPNILTISRIILTVIFMFFLFSEGLWAKSAAFVTFTIAALTDLFDGKIARRRNLMTNFGKLMDPIADKILVLSAFIAFVVMKLVPAWMVLIIFSRELLITGMRLFAAAKGNIISASLAGKHKTVSQMVSIFVILLFLICRESALRSSNLWHPAAEQWFKWSRLSLMAVTVVLTVVSGVSYIMRNRITLRNRL